MAKVRLSIFKSSSRTSEIRLCERNQQTLVGVHQLRILKVYAKAPEARIAVLASNSFTHVQLNEDLEAKVVYSPLELFELKRGESVTDFSSNDTWFDFSDQSDLVFWLQTLDSKKINCESLRVLFQYRRKI